MHTQKRVLVAGSTANFATSLIAFAALFLFATATSSFRESGIYIVTGAGELETGSLVRAINGQAITDSFEFPKFSAGQKATFSTDKGEKTLTANSDGKFGILYNPVYSSGIGGKMLWKPGFSFLEFIFSTVALIFLLNFIVGVVNLLPLPFFDGQRIFELSVPNKAFVQAVTLAVAAAFVLNFLPWMFR